MSAAGRSAPFGRAGWTPDRLPDLRGRIFVITGANSGIGYEAARMLGAKAATVILLCRDEAKAESAVTRLRSDAAPGTYDYFRLDLGDLASVRDAAAKVRGRCRRIDALVLNAGIMMLPERQRTAEGVEMQFGVNHLGHFLLAALLSDIVEASAGRFVSVASLAHRFAGPFRFDNLAFDRGYTPGRAYAQSKLANLVFARELDRRLAAAGARSRAYACHPGWSATNLQTTGPSAAIAALSKPLNAVFSQPAAKGAIPTVLCAAGAEAEPGRYYGPGGAFEFGGPVGPARIARVAEEADAAQLWAESARLTGARWPVLDTA